MGEQLRGKRDRSLKFGSGEEKGLEKYLGGRLDNLGNNWIFFYFLLGIGDDVEVQKRK